MAKDLTLNSNFSVRMTKVRQALLSCWNGLAEDNHLVRPFGCFPLFDATLKGAQDTERKFADMFIFQIFPECQPGQLRLLL